MDKDLVVEDSKVHFQCQLTGMVKAGDTVVFNSDDFGIVRSLIPEAGSVVIDVGDERQETVPLSSITNIMSCNVCNSKCML